MFKALRPGTFAGNADAKCGEVYFQSINSYRIDCAFCDMKSFVFPDFLLHIQNVHFENGLLKSEVVLPKQEKLDSSPGGTPVSQVNPFSWYDVANGDEESEPEYVDGTKQLPSNTDDVDLDVQDDPVGIASSAVTIMKWDTDPGNGRESVRTTRTLKVDYNESSEEELSDKQRTQRATKKEQSVCSHCNKTYQSRKMLERHMERQHKPMDSELDMTDADDDDDNDDDDDIDADYAPPKVLINSPSKPPAMAYKCEHCDKIYQGKYTLRQHVKRDHDISLAEAFICLECDAQLPRMRLLDEHVVKVHGGAPCVICGRRYKTRHELKRHQVKHTNERNVVCNHPGCEKRFFSTRHMRNHSKVHSEQKNFVCESCGYSCRNKETLRVHLRSHTGERPFACKVCDKRFPSHSGLREHMAMHSTERPHICKVCGATFSRQKGLYHHKFLHAATKQFKCKLCDNAYAQAAGLAGHMRKHRNDELNG